MTTKTPTERARSEEASPATRAAGLHRRDALSRQLNALAQQMADGVGVPKSAVARAMRGDLMSMDAETLGILARIMRANPDSVIQQYANTRRRIMEINASLG